MRVTSVLGLSLLCLVTATAISGCGQTKPSGANTQTGTGATGTATTVDPRASDGPSMDAGTGIPDVATKTSSKWTSGRQLILDQKWGSEGVPEHELLDNVKEAEATPDQRLVLALNDLGAFYLSQHRYEEAEQTYKRVLELQEKRLGNHYDVIYSHNDLGVVYAMAGKHDLAEKEFLKCIETGEKLDDVLRDDDEAETRHNYSVLLRKIGRGEEADQQEAKAEALIANRAKAIENMGKPPKP